MSETQAPPRSFAALRHPGARAYLLGTALAMNADAVEHEITYLVIWEKFESPTLGGFAVVAHWLPFLFFSIHTGALADWEKSRQYGVTGVPTYVADAKDVVGAHPYEVLERLLDAAGAQKRN